MKKSILFLLLIAAINVMSQTNDTDSVLIEERIQTIQNMLDQSKKPVNLWWYGWLGAYSAATVGQGAVYFISDDKATKQDMALGAATTVLGAAFQLLTPLNTGRDALTLAQLPETNTQERLLKLEMAEKLLEINANKEKAGRSWEIHALNSAVNLSSGLITWLAYKRSVWDGVINFALNTAITETQIWTQPTRTMRDYQNYCRKYKSGENPLSYQPQPEFYLRTYAGGVSLSIVF